ncbi:cupin domain-containing protein [Pararhizobium arenae]|uniref:cupin domain-containing protein n=1 Tax=Pararhizobium arenae TaxID=1856850 RepID=UPI00094B3080|nr:cupin domain-containing protein [Pararhizobium arenae]
MPKVDIKAIPVQKGTGYPPEFAIASAERLRHRLGDAGGLLDFGVNLTCLPPGNWSSQRHWHSHEDEFVYLIAGELTLVEDSGETVLCPGDCAAFPKGTGNGHHMINKSNEVATYLEIGSCHRDDLITCSDE